ncbi:unnamed protein product [Anisakis simplex]|uniref:Myosin_tail_1 domain-containing protein n=1 Tax=Anisakis simplex TaxID=6269 RepID=A0A0M3J9Y2_ANISI|nr:unnamed protein product [Anisakis simplex]
MRCENAEGLNKRFEKQLSDSKKEIKTQISAVDELNREAKRLEDRLRASESDRVTAETARRHLEDEIRRLKL